MTASATAPTPGVGATIGVFRRACGLTQTDLAARIGKSVQWVSGVEQGQKHAERLTDLVNIATVFGCSLDDLIGRPVDSLTSGARRAPQAEAIAAVRAVIMRAAVPETDAREIPELEAVSTRVAQAWSTWHGSPVAHSTLGRVLPSLLDDTIVAYHNASDRRHAARSLAGAYQITRQWLHHLPDGGLAWIAADRAMTAAREADDPHLIALGAWALSASYRRAGQQDEATRLCLAAASELKVNMDAATRADGGNPGPRLLADYGMLHLAAAVSSAQADEENRAWALHRIADAAARAIGDSYDEWTAFGRGNVDIHGLALRAELGRPDAVVEYSARLQIDDVPSLERRAAALINTARGYVQRGEDEAATLILRDAEKISQDEVHDSTLVRELLRELLHRDRARTRAHVRRLAQRCGLITA
jgi:transcriptional regulator with XRE-family HTH domain